MPHSHEKIDPSTLKNKSYFHFRFTDPENSVSPNGGVTVLYVEREGQAYLSSAICSLKDAYVKQSGRVKTLCRLSAICEKEKKFVTQLPYPISDGKERAMRAFKFAVQIAIKNLPKESLEFLERTGQTIVITPSLSKLSEKGIETPDKS